MTTNEHIDNLHPALARPGRCAATIEFPAFTEQEASDWLTSRGGNPQDAYPGMSLADLYQSIRTVV